MMKILNNIIKKIVTKYMFNKIMFGLLCESLYYCLSECDKKELNKINLDNYEIFISSIHHSYGRYLRNEYLLWEEYCPIVKWFKKQYNIEHADDISSLIIIGIIFRDNSILRDKIIDLSVESYLQHWDSRIQK